MKQRLDQLLVERGLAESRSQAARIIMSGSVKVEGVIRDKPGWPVPQEAVVELRDQPRYVSRAGDKLASANQKFGLDLTDQVVLDVGSSTGGFSDYCLQQGAARIYAVDVGTHQLHERIRAHEAVVVMEKTDIRSAELPELVDIAVIDVSFISLRQVIPSVVKLVKPEGLIIAMCKPQFEAGVKEASKHKGVIKNDSIRRRILKEFEAWLNSQGLPPHDKADSKVSGAKGNIERFYLIRT